MTSCVITVCVQRTLDVALIMVGKGKGVSLAQEDKQIKARSSECTHSIADL
jgi:hypothetical protein